jgi:hypothetical protein
MHGVKPLHVCKGNMHACTIREPRGMKRWTLVEISYDLGTRPALRVGSCSCRYLPSTSCLCRAQRTQASNSSATNGFTR